MVAQLSKNSFEKQQPAQGGSNFFRSPCCQTERMEPRYLGCYKDGIGFQQTLSLNHAVGNGPGRNAGSVGVEECGIYAASMWITVWCSVMVVVRALKRAEARAPGAPPPSPTHGYG